MLQNREVEGDQVLPPDFAMFEGSTDNTLKRKPRVKIGSDLSHGGSYQLEAQSRPGMLSS